MTEAAVMLSRFYRRMTGEPDRSYVIALLGSYHGSGPLATALSGEPILHDYSSPLDGYVRHIARPVPGTCGADAAGPSGGADAPAPCDGTCVRPFLGLLDEVGADRVTAVIFEPLLGTYLLPLPGHYLERVTAAGRLRSGFRTTCQPVGSRRGVARKRSERQQIRNQACPPRLPLPFSETTRRR
jgi:adenosylmethionine-8-amino-7-oxononanoate aminotransferase